MIHYQLVCAGSHGFDGWFRDSQSFEGQVAAGLVTCPDCGTASVRRALMAPSLGKRRAGGAVLDQEGRSDPQGGRQEVPPAPAGAPAEGRVAQVGGAGLPDQVRAMLQKLRAEVERTCEPVGERFAAEARAIHEGKAEARGIFGQSTPEEAAALAEDGIEVARIPWVPRSDA